MKKKYIIRLDDISPYMNYQNFARARNLFVQYGVQPLIGIIPANHDLKLMAASDHGISEEAFWKEMKYLQKEKGWSIAQHGYDHVYVTQDSGIFSVSEKSEFAGLPYDKQLEKIQSGKAILERNGLTVDCFMAPSHSLDRLTLRALRECDISVVTDGQRYYPYQKHGVVFVPQLHSWINRRGFGYDTVCFHINSWTDRNFDSLEKKIKEIGEQLTSFGAVMEDMRFSMKRWRIKNFFTAWIVESELYLRKLKRKKND